MIKMVCQTKIKELEKKLKRKLTPVEKKRIEELMHHTESSEHKHRKEEEPIPC
jgi:hypothetical protein